jgi:hypothetical protein
MAMILALFLAAAVQEEDPSLTEMPEGWRSGTKSGWDGDYPPGWEKKSDEEKKKFLEQWNAAKFRYIKFMQGAKGNPTGSVTGILFMLKAVNAGLKIPQAADLAMFGQNQKLKEPDFKAMMKGTCAVNGTEVPHGDAVNIAKDLVTSGIRGGTLEKRIGQEIRAKDTAIKQEKARKEAEKDKEAGKDNEGKDKKE